MSLKKVFCLLVFVTGAMAVECPAGYEVVGSKCIHRHLGGNLTHDDAVAYCYQNFGRLPVLHDCASFIDVATYVDDGYSADAINGYWLGATNSSANGVWQWNDGTAVQMGAPFWAVNIAADGKTEPNNALRGENCAMIGATRGWLLNDLSCTKSGFVVYAVCSRTPTDGLCATPYVLLGTQCIHLLLTDYNSWSDARTSCGATGGDLIILDDCDQYSKVTSYLNDQGYSPDGYWIGGSDEALEGQWRWIDGSTMAMGLPYWANTGAGIQEPDSPGVENCLELSSLWMYRFSNTLCSNTRRVICEAQPL
ncbi:C-type mannose receptor 2 [Hyalella azteca]|uniref:C-type mannose receptor 2 n=1 Tax=Hyalella azteca TaxID=294128 RepID=A0A8B7NSA2_HYAAZ|nr:C-type mannose receptor 2 [Hyalella azteca]XP_018016589.1 C-type mannose receptor 2 [Hyalella azteca]XP_047736839.1 C-type mannose receptor 2 [Hyalella azteca]